MARAPRRAGGVGGDNPEFVLRAFGTVSNNAARQDIGDEELYWLENLMPLADGNAQSLPGPTAALLTIFESSLPLYACSFTVTSENFIFVNFPSGNGYIIDVTHNLALSIGNTFPPGTVATPYNNQGLLILTPSAYYDWNVTTVNALTKQNNTVTGATITLSNPITSGGTGADIILTNKGFTPNDGTGGVAQVHYNCTAASILSGGQNYLVGDNLSMTGGSAITPTVVQVTAVDGLGAIQSVTVTTAGSYHGPNTNNTATLPGGANFTGGAGTGGILELSYQVIAASVTIVTPGTGYAGGEVTQDFSGAALVTKTTMTAAAGALTGGTINTNNTVNNSAGSDIPLTNDGFTPNDGTGASLKVYYQVASIAVTAGGTGYVPGDLLTLVGGQPESGGVQSPSNSAQILVNQVGAGGAITGIQLSRSGSYAGPVTSGSAILPGGKIITGGSGSGATFGARWQAIPSSVFVVTPGANYAGGETSDDKVGNIIFTTIKLTSSGIIGGQAIAVYAGRVWLASQRTIFVSEINSYVNFGGSGTNFTIQEAYLHGIIQALYAANNYLYIFGQDSIDALSNVTVNSGLVAFSRVNLVTGIGTTNQASVTGYLRGVLFQHASGYYLLAGASPERVSEKIQGFVRQAGGPVFSTLLTLNGELNVCIATAFFDVFSGGPQVTRTALACYFRGKWWMFAPPSLVSPVVVSTIGGAGAAGDAGQAVLYYFRLNAGVVNMYRAFNPGANALPWVLRTKLWDAQAPLKEKQALVAAVASLNGSGLAGGLTYTIDTELQSFTPVTPPTPANTSTGYQLWPSKVDGGGGQYIGFTVNGSLGAGAGLTGSVSLAALRGLAERDFLQ